MRYRSTSAWVGKWCFALSVCPRTRSRAGRADRGGGPTLPAVEMGSSCEERRGQERAARSRRWHLSSLASACGVPHRHVEVCLSEPLAALGSAGLLAGALGEDHVREQSSPDGRSSKRSSLDQSSTERFRLLPGPQPRELSARAAALGSRTAVT